MNGQNFTPEEREARLVAIARHWADGLSLVDIGLEIGIAGKNVNDWIKRARKRGDTRFPIRSKNLRPVKVAKWPLTPDALAAEKDKRTTMAEIARRVRVPSGRIKRMYYALKRAGDPRFQEPWPLTPTGGLGRKPQPKAIAERPPVVRDTSGPVTITKCPVGYAAGLSWLGCPPGVRGVHPAGIADLLGEQQTPQHVHRTAGGNGSQRDNGRGAKRLRESQMAADRVLR